MKCIWFDIVCQSPFYGTLCANRLSCIDVMEGYQHLKRSQFLHADNEDSADAQADLSFRSMQMSEGTLSHVTASTIIDRRGNRAGLLL